MGGWFLQIVDIGNFNMKLNGRWFLQIVDRDSGNLYQIYIIIQIEIVVLASEPVGGRSSTTELPCFDHDSFCDEVYGSGFRATWHARYVDHNILS